LGLFTDASLALSPKGERYKLPTGVYGPFPSGTVGIISGRSGLTSQDLLCIQVWIHNRDGDSKEDIKTMADEEKEMQIEAGDKIAQLLFPYIKGNAIPVE
jgi:dUTPase